MLDYTKEQLLLFFFSFLLLHVISCISVLFWSVLIYHSTFKLLKSNKYLKKKKKFPAPLHPCTPFSSFLTRSLAHTHSYTHTNTVNQTGQCIILFPSLSQVFFSQAILQRRVHTGRDREADALLSLARTRQTTRWRTTVCSSSGARRRTLGAWAGSCRCWQWAGAPGPSHRCGCRRLGKAPVCIGKLLKSTWQIGCSCRDIGTFWGI